MRPTIYRLDAPQTWVSTTRAGRRRTVLDITPPLLRCADARGRVATVDVRSFRCWLRDNVARPAGSEKSL